MDEAVTVDGEGRADSTNASIWGGWGVSLWKVKRVIADGNGATAV